MAGLRFRPSRTPRLRWLCALSIAWCAHGGQQPFAWKNVNIQGMGYVTGMIAHPLPPHDLYIRTDVGGAYRFDRDARRWLPLLDHFGTLQSEIYGIESVAADPTDPNTIYIAAQFGRTISGSGVFTPAEVHVSHNRGGTWTPTGLAAQNVYLGANDSFRGMTGERLAADPHQQGNLFFASRKDGLWHKLPGEQWFTTGWAKVGGGLPASTDAPGINFVIFDPTSGVTSTGSTQTLYAGIYGSGVWRSTDGGTTWSNIQGGTTPLRAAMASDGTLYVTFGGDEGGLTGSVNRFQRGKWTDITPPNNRVSYSGISVDPSNANVVMAAQNGNLKIYRSTDQGNTWQQVQVSALANPPAYYPSNAGGWGNAALLIDPLNPKRVWQTNGYGVIATQDVTATPSTWSWVMKNLEELVVQKVKVPPVNFIPGTNERGADLFSMVADMVGFRHASRDQVPLSTIDTFQWVAQATSLSYCGTMPEHAAFVGWDEASANAAMSGITADNGKTWIHIPNPSPGTGGNIAMSATDPNNMVWAPHAATPQYTQDGGKTWRNCTLNGSALPKSWQISNEWWNGNVLMPDLVTGGTFYYYDSGSFYSSADGGATWTLGNTSWPQGQDPHWTIGTNIVPNPARAGDVWMAFSANSNQTTNFQLVHSSDGGKTFGAVATMDRCNYVAFGQGLTAGAPYMYMHGRANGDTEDAVYKSEDMAQTWLRISDPRLQQFGGISSLEGDMRTRNLVYAGTGGRGIFYGSGYDANADVSQFAPSRMVNYASTAGGPVAPGEMLLISLPQAGSNQLVPGIRNEAGWLSTQLRNMQVLFDGVPAPIVYSQGTQAAVMAPYAIAGQDHVLVQQLLDGALSAPASLSVAASAPGVFASTNGAGAAVAYNEDWGLNSATHPAPRGSTVHFWITGDGLQNRSLVDGTMTAPWFASPSSPLLPVQVTIGGTQANATAAAAARSVAGLTQVDVIVPAGAPSGNAISLLVTVGTASSQDGVTISIK